MRELRGDGVLYISFFAVSVTCLDLVVRACAVEPADVLCQNRQKSADLGRGASWGAESEGEIHRVC